MSSDNSGLPAGTSPDHGAMLDGFQYLRALGALIVVAVHAKHYFGNDIWISIGTGGATLMSFFVISAFVIAHTTDHIKDGGDLRRTWDFLRKRLIRIVPLYWLALLWKSAGNWENWLSAPNPLKAIYWNWAARQPGLLQDMIFIPHPNVYHRGHFWPMVVPAWTLNYEMVFYLFFALALLCGRHKHVVVFMGLALAAAFGALLGDGTTFSKMYSWPVFLEFALGVGMYLAYKHGSRFGPRGKSAMLVLLGGALAVYVGSQTHSRLGVSVGAALLIWGCAFLPRSRSISMQILKRIGDASYCIYIFHTVIAFEVAYFFLDRFSDVKARVIAGDEAQLAVAAAILFIVIVSTLIGLLLHQYLEKPLASLLLHGGSARRSAAPTRAPT
jgi:exopolysaccharide production protein ExoZ